VLWVLTLATLAACGAGCARVPDLPPGVARVAEVVDGDTLDVVLDGRRQRLRLLGIDTPETVHPTRPTECFGPEASRALASLTPPGTDLRLERDVQLRDRYGRLLAYAWLPDGTFINETLVAGGFATTLHIDPNGAHRIRLATAETAARNAGAGLWSACPAR
jgi:micrococcal nuclease